MSFSPLPVILRAFSSPYYTRSPLSFCFKCLTLLGVFFTLSACSRLDLKSLSLKGWGQKWPTKAPQKTAQATFKPIWIKNHDPQYETGNLPVGLQSPLVHGGLVYIGHNAGEMRAYELETGRLVWKAQDKGEYHGGPILLGDYITYGTTEGRVYTRHRLSGELIWNVDLGASIESRATLSGGRLFFHVRNHKIFCLDARTGKILWAYKRSIPFITSLQRVSRPLVLGNRLYVGFADGVVAAFSVEEGVPLWETKIVSGTKFIDADLGPLRLNRRQILVGSPSGPLVILDRRNGKIKRKLKYAPTRRPLVSKKHFVLGTSQGEVILFDKNLRKKASRKLSEVAIASMALWKGGLVASTVDGHLYYMDLKNLKMSSSLHFGHQNSAVFGDLAVKEGKLVAYSSRNRLYVFE